VVRFHPSILLYFNELVDVLFYENYFSIRESAIDYVTRLIDTVKGRSAKRNITLLQRLLHTGAVGSSILISVRKQPGIFYLKKVGTII